MWRFNIKINISPRILIINTSISSLLVIFICIPVPESSTSLIGRQTFPIASLIFEGRVIDLKYMCLKLDAFHWHYFKLNVWWNSGSPVPLITLDLNVSSLLGSKWSMTKGSQCIPLWNSFGKFVTFPRQTSNLDCSKLSDNFMIESAIATDWHIQLSTRSTKIRFYMRLWMIYIGWHVQLTTRPTSTGLQCKRLWHVQLVTRPTAIRFCIKVGIELTRSTMIRPCNWLHTIYSCWWVQLIGRPPVIRLHVIRRCSINRSKLLQSRAAYSKRMFFIGCLISRRFWKWAHEFSSLLASFWIWHSEMKIMWIAAAFC